MRNLLRVGGFDLVAQHFGQRPDFERIGHGNESLFGKVEIESGNEPLLPAHHSGGDSFQLCKVDPWLTGFRGHAKEEVQRRGGRLHGMSLGISSHFPQEAI